MLRTNTAQYAGVVNTVYWGDRVDIWQYLFLCHSSETIMGAFILFAGVITVLFSIALGVVYKTKFDMEYLGWCMIMGAPSGCWANPICGSCFCPTLPP